MNVEYMSKKRKETLQKGVFPKDNVSKPLLLNVFKAQAMLIQLRVVGINSGGWILNALPGHTFLLRTFSCLSLIRCQLPVMQWESSLSKIVQNAYHLSQEQGQLLKLI